MFHKQDPDLLGKNSNCSVSLVNIYSCINYCKLMECLRLCLWRESSPAVYFQRRILMPGEKVAHESPWSVSQTDRADKLSGQGEQIRDIQQSSTRDQLLPSTTPLTAPRSVLGETKPSLSSQTQPAPQDCGWHSKIPHNVVGYAMGLSHQAFLFSFYE